MTRVAPLVTRCVDCHVPVDANGVADHSMVGGNVYLASEVTKDSTMTANEHGEPAAAHSRSRRRASGDAVDVTVSNRGAGHAFPTGVTDIREPWVELASGRRERERRRRATAAPRPTAPSRSTPRGSACDIAAADGELLYLHELSQIDAHPFARVVPPLRLRQTSSSTRRARSPRAAVQLDAVLYYRNVRTPYFRAATGERHGDRPRRSRSRASPCQ